MPKSNTPEDLRHGFEISAKFSNLTQGMTFLRLVPHVFGEALLDLKTRHSPHAVSFTVKKHDLKIALRDYFSSPEKKHFNLQSDFLIHDVVELTRIFAEAQKAASLSVTFFSAYKPLEPFLPHGGLRILYDTLPNEDAWALFRMNGMRSQLSPHALIIDCVLSAREEGTYSKQGDHDVEFLARLKDYESKLHVKEYPGVSEMDMELIAKVMQIEPIDFDQDSKWLKEIKEWEEGTEFETKRRSS